MYLVTHKLVIFSRAEDLKGLELCSSVFDYIMSDKAMILENDVKNILIRYK